VPVGTVLAYVLVGDEEPPAAVPPVPAVAASADTVDSAAAATGAVTEQATNEPSAGQGSGSGVTISPRARRLAGELGVDWERLAGTGRTGRITEEDVRVAAESVVPAEDCGDAKGIPMSPIRRAIAERLVTSHRDAAPVTLTAELDATELVALRSKAKPRPAYNDYLIRFVAVALQRHSGLNSSLRGDDILLHSGIHIGFAVDTEAGLLVPVVRDADKKSVEEIGRESASLGGRALRGELKGEEMAGGTFTITNLGAAGIDAFTPIINPPQCAILGVGRISQRPAVHEGQIVPRWLTVVSLSFDHRLIDGGPAARFLATLRELVEQPESN